MNTQGFYTQNGTDLLYAPTFVSGLGMELIIDQKDSYTYPVNDWYYFDSEEEAKTFFNI